jgi:hypothetical protein
MLSELARGPPFDLLALLLDLWIDKVSVHLSIGDPPLI